MAGSLDSAAPRRVPRPSPAQGPGARGRNRKGARPLKGRFLQVGAVGVILALAATGCSRSTGGGASSTNKTVKLGVIAPLTGPLSALGLGIKNGADLAIKQANQKGTVKGYTIVLDAQDDTATAATGANAANKLASDPLVAGVVGT